jgi:hypothetical protein
MILYTFDFLPVSTTQAPNWFNGTKENLVAGVIDTCGILITADYVE